MAIARTTMDIMVLAGEAGTERVTMHRSAIAAVRRADRSARRADRVRRALPAVVSAVPRARAETAPVVTARSVELLRLSRFRTINGRKRIPTQNRLPEMPARAPTAPRSGLIPTAA